ncbi:MAG TPA: hypothetical protein VGD76_20920, partial [Ramlibacter sp.]
MDSRLRGNDGAARSFTDPPSSGRSAIAALDHGRPGLLRQLFEPLQDDEVAAFRKALDAGVRGEQALASVNNGRTPQSYTLLTGFEDTEM